MSMEVDFSTPLTEQERAYLLMRGRSHDVERADNQTGGQTPDEMLSGDGTGTQPVSLMTSDRMAQRKAELERELRLIEEAEQATADTDEDDELPPYEAWKVADLDKELKARNLAVTGSKEEKAARLNKDDETAGA